MVDSIVEDLLHGHIFRFWDIWVSSILHPDCTRGLPDVDMDLDALQQGIGRRRRISAPDTFLKVLRLFQPKSFKVVLVHGLLLHEVSHLYAQRSPVIGGMMSKRVEEAISITRDIHYAQRLSKGLGVCANPNI